MRSFSGLEITETMASRARALSLAGMMVGASVYPTNALSAGLQSTSKVKKAYVLEEFISDDTQFRLKKNILDVAVSTQDVVFESILVSVHDLQDDEKLRIRKAIDEAKLFLQNNGDLSPDNIMLTQDGEINLWWERRKSRLDLGFMGDGEFYFYCRLADGTEILRDNVSVTEPLIEIVRSSFL